MDDFENITEGLGDEITESVIKEVTEEAYANIRSAFSGLSECAGGVYQEALKNGLPDDLASLLASTVIAAYLYGSTD